MARCTVKVGDLLLNSIMIQHQCWSSYWLIEVIIDVTALLSLLILLLVLVRGRSPCPCVSTSSQTSFCYVESYGEAWPTIATIPACCQCETARPPLGALWLVTRGGRNLESHSKKVYGKGLNLQNVLVNPAIHDLISLGNQCRFSETEVSQQRILWGYQKYRGVSSVVCSSESAPCDVSKSYQTRSVFGCLFLRELRQD